MFFTPVNKFYSDKIPESRKYARLGYLERVYEDLIQSFNNKGREDLIKSIYLNRAILLQVVSCYFYDVERLKHFHSIDRIDDYKIGGFMMKWILKLKPVFFDNRELDPKIEVNKLHLCCNEMFALKVGLAMAKIKLSKISDEFLNKQIYHFVYRNVDEHMLMMWLEAIDR
jgi:hypothetical protein